MRKLFIFPVAVILLASCASTESKDRKQVVKRIIKMQDEIGKKNRRIAALKTKNKMLQRKLNKKEKTTNKINEKSTKSAQIGEKRLYDLFAKKYRQGSIRQAERALRLLTKAYPKSSHIPEAHFLIAKEQANKKQYKKSVYHYNQIIQVYPKSNLISTAKLEKAKLYHEMNLSSPATKVLKELISENPRSKEAKLARRYLNQNAL